MTTIKHNQFPRFHTIQHPLVYHKLAMLRKSDTNSTFFRSLVHEITLLLGFEATKHLLVQSIDIETPLEKCQASILTKPEPVILPILRAGNGMVNALLTLMPMASVGHIGLYRNEDTKLPHEYYFNIPAQVEERPFFVCDPMLATAGSATAAISLLKKHNIHNITFICIVASPEGLRAFYQAHPDVPIYAASLDRGLNEKAYVVPGLGDAGDRLFGTV